MVLVKHSGAQCRKPAISLICALCLGASLAGAQEDVLTIDGAQIRGDQVSPNVLYLMRWQKPEVDSLTRSEGTLVGGREIEPLERSEFQRLVSYHERFLSLQKEAGEM